VCPGERRSIIGQVTGQGIGQIGQIGSGKGIGEVINARG
jgi:hypothetical protein